MLPALPPALPQEMIAKWKVDDLPLRTNTRARNYLRECFSQSTSLTDS